MNELMNHMFDTHEAQSTLMHELMNHMFDTQEAQSTVMSEFIPIEEQALHFNVETHISLSFQQINNRITIY